MPPEAQKSVEDDIFDRIAASGATEDEGDEGTTPQTPETEETPPDAGADGATQARTAADDGGTAPVQPTKEAVPATKDGAQQPVTPPVAEITDHPSLHGYKVNKAGAIVDAQGNVVAEAGRERRWFENAASLHGYLGKQQRYTQNLEAKLREMAEQSKEALDGIPTRLGLQREEVDMGLQLAATYKRDPVSVAKYIVAETMKLGYTMEQITGEKGSNSIDMQAIKGLLDERLGPIGEQRQQQQTQQNATQRAQQAYKDFMDQFPDAGPHQNEIAAVAQQGNISPTSAYFELRKWATERGLDWSQPLKPQLQRAMQPSQQTRQPAPLPNGGTPADSVTNTPQLASADDDYDDIIKGAMRDAGMNV